MSEKNTGEARSYSISLAGEIVTAYVSNNKIDAADVPALISQTHNAIAGLQEGGAGFQHTGEPAVAIDKSITPDFVICLEDGKKLKMLKRYLRTHYNLSPEDYRRKWGLPADYPMTAPNYSKKRSRVAKSTGLGKAPTRRNAPTKRKAAKKRTVKKRGVKR